MNYGSSSHRLLSVVVPALNEEGTLAELYERIRAQFDSLAYEFEVLFVDDGSTDGSLAVLRSLNAQDARVKAVVLSRNFGHQIALTAGLDHAAGAAVITMDADLQHPSELIPKMIAAWEEGFDVVNTIREETLDIGLLKRVASRLFYKMINGMTRTPINPDAADFRLLDRTVVDCLNRMKEKSRFLRGMTGWLGFRQIGIPYRADRRQAGETKYSLVRMLGLGIDGITSFSSFPLRIATYIGFVAAIVGLPYGIWAIYARLFTDTTVPGWASLVIVILFLGGVQLISLGIIGEYIGRIYEEVKDRPLYLAQERIGFEDSSPRRASYNTSEETPPEVQVEP